MRYAPDLLQVRGSSLLIYEEPSRFFSGGKSIKRQANIRNQQKKQYGGGLSAGGRKRMAKSVTLLCQACKPAWILNPISKRYHLHRVSFLTLTVTEGRNNLTARQGYDALLAPFLDWMRKTMGVKTYIWKAEFQKRGQLHYHITTPSFLHMDDIRMKWNYLQREAGLLNRWAKDHGHYCPPSTEIHETQSVRKMDRYLIKELGKSLSAVQVEAIAQAHTMRERGEITAAEETEKIEAIKKQKFQTVGKVWDCSNDLVGTGYFHVELTKAHEAQIEQWIQEKKVFVKKEERYMIVHCGDVDPPDILSKNEGQAFEKFLNFVRTGDLPSEANIPAYCVQMELTNKEETYSIEQLTLFLN